MVSINSVYDGLYGRCFSLSFSFFKKFFLDKIIDLIGFGGFADVYRCVSQDTNTEMAVKVFKPSFKKEPILRDVTTGFNRDLESEYTVKYRDEFTVTSGAGNLQCVVMDLMDCSLSKFLLNRNGELLSDDVYSFIILERLNIIRRSFLNLPKLFWGCLFFT
jgi:serine/threonine protein kinase